MVDLQLVRDAGVTQEKLKELLGGDPRAKTEKVAALINRIRSRIQEGMTRNFSEYKTYYALDEAWNTPFRQISPTLMQMFQQSDPSSPDVEKQLQALGLTNLITEQLDEKTGKPTGKKVFNLPIFFHVLVPLCRAYVTIRWSKIMNDRRLTPFLKYSPAKMTTALRAKCEVLTDRVETVSQQYSYYKVAEQSVLKMLHYSFCFQLPKEEWHSEEQWRVATEADVKLGKKKAGGAAVVVGDKIKVTDREGIRYHHPHPTRIFWDIAHPKYTLNTDCGAEYVGYWKISRYRDLLAANLWYPDRIPLGANDVIGNNSAFFQTVYSACTLAYPVLRPVKTPDGVTLSAEVGVGVGDQDREKQLALQFYGNDHLDQGVLTTEYFEKLNPKENGLGDYDCPIWFRFVVAGDSGTILYAAPLPYSPCIYYGYDPDESRTQNAGMTLETIPFQDQFSNTLNQIILTSRQNLANAVFVDEDQMDDDQIKRIQNSGESFFRKLNIFGYSGRKSQRAQNRINEVAHSVTFPKGSVAELTNVLKTILDILERVLVMSSQEVAQAASHEQTREEIRNIAHTTSNRLKFTATAVDLATEAWKRQLYQGLMAYGDDDMYAMLPAEAAINKEWLERLGFTYVDKDDTTGMHTVSATKKSVALPLWAFASSRDGDDRPNDQQTAQAMAMLWDKVLTNPITAQAIGADQAIEWANRIGQLAGLDRDFKLRNTGASPEEQQKKAQEELKHVVEVVLQQVDQKMMQALTPIMDQVKQNSQTIAQLVQLAQSLNPQGA